MAGHHNMIFRLTCILFTVVSLVACSDKDVNHLNKKIQLNNGYFEIAYSEKFRQRFSLSSTGLTNLRPGLEAVATEITHVNNAYQCKLHYYLNDSIDLLYPSSSKYFSNKPTSEYFFVSGYNDEDQTFNSDALRQNQLRLLFISHSADHKKRFMSTLSYHRVHRNFLPSLTLASVSVDCLLLQVSYQPAGVWAQTNADNSLSIGNLDIASKLFTSNSIRLDVPHKLIEKVSQPASIASAYNLNQLLKSTQ